MELILLVGLAHPSDDLLKAVKDPAVHLRHLFIRRLIRVGFKVIEITQDEAAGISDPTVRLNQTLEDLRGDPDVLGVILGGHPESEDLGAVLVDDRLGVDDVTH